MAKRANYQPTENQMSNLRTVVVLTILIGFIAYQRATIEELKQDQEWFTKRCEVIQCGVN